MKDEIVDIKFKSTISKKEVKNDSWILNDSESNLCMTSAQF